MAKVKISKDKISELFTLVLADFGDLIRTDELRWGIADRFIKACEDYGVGFEIDENLFPKEQIKPKSKPNSKKMENELIEAEKIAVEVANKAVANEPADIQGKGMKAKRDSFDKFLKKDTK